MAAGGFEARHYKMLAEDLLALALQRQRLPEGRGEPLDIDALLGRGPATARTEPGWRWSARSSWARRRRWTF